MGSTSGRGGGRDGSFSHWWRGLFSENDLGRAGRRKRRGTGLQTRRLRFESCEDRRLLTIGVNFAGGVLTLTGTADTDQVAVVGQTSYLDVYVDGNFQARILNANSSNVNVIAFSGGDGDDSLAVQNVKPSGSLAINLTDVETLSVLKSRNVTATANAALNLDTSSISGTLSLTALGELTQTGQVVVAGAATLNVGANDITLTNAANNFATVSLGATAQNVSLRDVNAIVLGTVSVTGDLSVEANLNSTSRTAISQSSGTALIVGGSTTLTVGPASTITLNNTNNQFTGTVSITGATATLRNTLATDLGESRVTRNLTLTSTGNVTQSGALFVGQTATVSAAGADIDLSVGDNDFRVLALSGFNVAVNDVNALILGKSNVTGTLDVTADGAIAQSGALTVGGDATLTTAETANITLSNSGNDFLLVGIVAANNVVLRDKNALELAESTISGALTVTTAGAITQSGALTVADKTTLTAGTGATNHITLTEANDFEELAIVSARNVELTDTNELLLATSRIYGTLIVTAGGSVTQSGAVTVTGLATFNLTSGDLTLNHASNNFGVVTIPSAPGSVWLRDTNSLVLGNVAVADDLTLQANLNSSSRTALSQLGSTAITVGGSTTLAAGSASTITLNNSGNVLHGSDPDDAVSVVSAYATLRNNADTQLGPSSVSRNLSVASTGGITQSGPLFVGRIANLSAAVDIVLADADNDFGTVMASAGNVTLNDVNSLVLGASTVGGALDVTTNGAITQNGALNVSGPTTLTAGQDNNITLTHSGNQFSSVGVLSGRNVALRDANALDLALSTIAGTLAVTTAGAITQSGALEVAEKTTLTAGATNNITLNDSANNFSEISIVSGYTVSIENAPSLVLGSSKVDALRVVLHGPDSGLSQSGAVVVADGALLEAAQGIELLNAGNIFPILAVVSDGDVLLRTMGAIEVDGADVVGDLNLTAGGAITQSDVISVGGMATLATNASASITLDTTNVLNEVAVTSAKNVTIANAGALVLGASNIAGDLDVTAGGDLTQSGALVVAGTLTIDTAGANVDLSTELGNDFRTVNLTGQDVALNTTNSIVLAAAAIGGNLTIQAAGTITDDGTVTVAGDTTLTAGTDIELDEVASAYAGILSLQGANIDVFNTVATVLGDCTATGNMTVTADATLTNEVAPTTYSTLLVNGIATFDAGAYQLDLYVTSECVFGELHVAGTPPNVWYV